MATVFDVFKEVSYSYLAIAQSTVRGDMIVRERELLGIFKDKAGQTQNGNMELTTSTATLHIHPEDFPDILSCDSLIGDGIRVDNQTYSIVGASAGANFDTGAIEHYRLTLQKADFAGDENE